MNEADMKQVRKARLRGLYANVPEVGPQTVHFDIANACNDALIEQYRFHNTASSFQSFF